MNLTPEQVEYLRATLDAVEPILSEWSGAGNPYAKKAWAKLRVARRILREPKTSTGKVLARG